MPKHSIVLATANALALGGPRIPGAANNTVTSLTDNFLAPGSFACTLRLAVEAANDNMAQAGCIAGDASGIDGNADGDAECDIGSVEFVDLFGPLRTLTSAPDVTSPGASSYELTVTYTDLDGEVDFITVGIGDITVVTVLNDDADESVYTFALQGEAVAAVELIYADSFE